MRTLLLALAFYVAAELLGAHLDRQLREQWRTA